MKKLFLIVVIQLSLLSLFSQSSLNEAYRAYRACNYSDARNKYLKIWNDNSVTNKDKKTAGSKLAYLSWHISQNLNEARDIINKSLEYETDEIDLLLELSEYEVEANNFTEAKKLCYLSSRYRPLSNNGSRKVFIQQAKIALDEAIHLIETGGSVNKPELKSALDNISEVNKNNPGQLDVCEIQLGLALLLERGDMAFQSWKGYFRVPSDQKAGGILANTENTLMEILSGSNNSLSKSDNMALIKALANSRFYHYADLIARANNLKISDQTPELNDILNYYAFCKKADLLSTEYHRDIALNGLEKDKREAFYNNLSNIEMELWSQLSWDKKQDKFSKSGFEDELYKRFGTVFKKVKPYYTSMGKTGLFFFAHTVFDDRVPVEQYGYKASVHYVSLDFMYANSYDGWFLGSRTGRLGGWSSSSLIVQMRRAYSDKPVTMWNKITDPELNAEWQTEIIKLTGEDEKKSKNTPYAYFPGTVNKLQYNACASLLNELRSEGYSETDLRLAFISNFEAMLIQSSIFCHEGRHFIDNRYRFVFEPTCRDYEFRAKCSEIIFSENPIFSLAFSSVYRKDLDSRSKHSRGSRKAIENLAGWMESNANEIDGYKPERAALTQLDMLSNSQIRKAFLDMDPLSEERSK